MYRYIDWVITTPLLIVTLILFLSQFENTTQELPNCTIILVLIINWVMLLLGYVGEEGVDIINNDTAWICSFIFFTILFGLLYFIFLRDKKYRPSMIKYIFFFYFFILWVFYGVIYKLPYRQRNIYTNILDTFSKGFFGFFILFYFIVIRNSSIKYL